MRKPLRLDIGLFAHNEASNIAATIGDVGRQDIFACENIDIKLLILANGCRDHTVAVAQQAIAGLPLATAAHFEVLDIPEGGKSRTGHRFIHDLSRKDADLLGFMDADIKFPRPDTLRLMTEALQTRPELKVFVSRPVKDINHYQYRVSPVARLIGAGSEGLSDWRKSISGQLFILCGKTARRIALPTGLPVEDGFLRAMILTNLLSRSEDLSVIDGDPSVFHLYRSIRSVKELLDHQTRLVIGSAINAALFRKIRREAPTESEAHNLLMDAAANEDWLQRTLSEELPRKPHGYVPVSFLTKRWHRFLESQNKTPKKILILIPGLAMDALVWLRASWAMHRGTGPGHW